MPTYQKTRYQRSTKGENAEVYVGNPTAYTAQASPALFEANAAEGEIGVYDSTTGALYTTALAAGTKYQVYMMQDGKAICTAPIIHDPTKTRQANYKAPVKQVTTVNFSAAQLAYSDAQIAAIQPNSFNPVNNNLEFVLIETTPGNYPYPTLSYDYQFNSPAGLTTLIILTAIVARINNPLDIIHKDDGQQYTASIASDGAGGQNITITSFYYGQHFRVALRGLLTGGTVTYTTPFVRGIGDSTSVGFLEKEGWVYRGIPLYYEAGMRPEEFGEPSAHTQTALTYNVYHIDPYRQSTEINDGVRNFRPHIEIIVPVPVGASAPLRAASSPDYTLGTVLGFTQTP